MQTSNTPPATLHDKPPAVSDEQFNLVLAERGNRLDDLVTRILPDLSAKDHSRLLQTIEMTVDGILWRVIEGKTGIRWCQITAWSNIAEFRALWHAARDAGEDYRRELRVGAAHARAVDGWDEPVYNRGVQCGVIRRFSDRLLEMLMKADDPRYRDSGHQVNVNNQCGVQVIFENPRQEPPETGPERDLSQPTTFENPRDEQPAGTGTETGLIAAPPEKAIISPKDQSQIQATESPAPVPQNAPEGSSVPEKGGFQTKGKGYGPAPALA